ncbi:O-acetyl-ADP-ribose deacetylase [Piscirickettsia litoralis]|uniref:O-acetyl-ADP-ribose deacetylase n=1 Tax=Piscirickettsia litoralis TaxID=1891921 RepID=A0ABX3A3P8_9GAMM|nr:O-acetyl-ADP-ribose deacetylase [Piscirickettsia litoralis]ODN42276.1 O-acetyl-ADP-ribose deacetylase [Piscirickettsia litoralis]
MNHQITVLHTDITQLSVDAIVNAANESLLGGGGVDGAIHRAAGPQLLEKCKTLGGCPTGQARLTPGYKLAARFIIHTVGPIWQGGKYHEKESLHSCYCNSLKLAEQHKLTSIAFPAISCGIYGFPLESAGQIAINAITSYLCQSIKVINLVAFDKETKNIYDKILSNL